MRDIKEVAYVSNLDKLPLENYETQNSEEMESLGKKYYDGLVILDLGSFNLSEIRRK